MSHIALVSCTKHQHKEETLLYKSVVELKDNDDPYCAFDYVHFFTNNTDGLSQRYNEFIENNINDYDIITFVHDDVYIDDGKIINKLESAHEQYDIVGIAGGLNPTIRQPALWHIMCGGFGPNLRGFAGHYINNEQISITNFGPTPSRVAIIDGVFFSIKTKSIKESGWKFNENYTFHHYDIASCIDANRLKLKIGVWPILLYHMSPGLRDLNSTVFLQNQKKFIEEYSKD
jgi:hypothetical protein